MSMHIQAHPLTTTSLGTVSLAFTPKLCLKKPVLTNNNNKSIAKANKNQTELLLKH